MRRINQLSAMSGADYWAVKPKSVTITTVEPPDWSTNRTSYYYYSGGSLVQAGSSDTWTANKYYFNTNTIYKIFVPSMDLKHQKTNLTGSSTGWTEAGENVIDWIRPKIFKVNLAYKAMTESELCYMADLIDGKEFYFYYRDLKTVYDSGKSAYCGEMTYTQIANDMGYGEPIYKECQMNVVQTWRD